MIFQSPTLQENASEKDQKVIDQELLQSFIAQRQKDTPNLYNNRSKRSMSRAGYNRASCMINPLTESYDHRNFNLDRYNSMKSFNKKPRKRSKNRNSYRCTSSSTQGLIHNMRSSNVHNTESQDLKQNVQQIIPDHRKSTKMLIDCLLKQLNPVTAYINDFEPRKEFRASAKDCDRSRNENTSSMFLDINEKLKNKGKDLICASNIRFNTSHYIHYNTKY